MARWTRRSIPLALGLIAFFAFASAEAQESCACPGILAPVCGVDGNTWINPCEAECAMVEVESAGACPPPECGGPEGLACEEGEFCETRPGCDAMAAGVCEMVPEVCTEEFAPVCGCDGETYGNDCERRNAGVPLDFEGACEPVVCEDNYDCEENEYCQKRTGSCDSTGVCEPRPEVCPLVIDPVCGCDGGTYDNACDAAGAGTSLEGDEACRSDERKVTLCHIPPGNPDNRKTIQVGRPALPAHLAHGDSVGRCGRGR